MEELMYEVLYRTEEDHWWYRVRREMVHALIGRYVANVEGRFTILDAGCGTGALLKELGRYGEVHGVDVAPEAVRYCRRRGLERVEQGSVEALPFPNGMFDLVLALDVLEHVEDDLKAFSEIGRALKPDGTVIIFVPAFMFLWGVTDVVSRHYRRYTLPELRARVAARGFTVLRASYFNFFLFLPILAARLGVRLFRIQPREENETGIGVFNGFWYHIFHLESRLLRWLSFPFGISLLIVAQKTHREQTSHV